MGDKTAFTKTATSLIKELGRPLSPREICPLFSGKMPQLAIGVGVTSTLAYLLYREALSVILIGMPEFTTTYDIDPHAGDAGFDDSAWPIIPPTELAAKRGGGKVSFLWFRTRLTIPTRLGTVDPAGATVVLALCVDDYAEIWVDGDLPRAAGRPRQYCVVS